MKISIIINCYNSERYLKESIESVLNQTYKNFELILFDNCSKDDTQKIISSFNDNRISYLRSDRNLVLGCARNEAIKNSQFDWVAFIDSDDTWHKNKLYEQVNYVNLNKDIPLIYTDFKYIDDKSIFLNKSSYTEYHDEKVFEKLLNKNFICFSSVLFDKSKITEKKIFNPILQNSEDLDLLLKISQKSKIGYIKKKLVNYRINQNNLTKFQLKRSFAEWQYLNYEYNRNNIDQKKFIKKKFLYNKLKNKIRKIFKY